MEEVRHHAGRDDVGRRRALSGGRKVGAAEGDSLRGEGLDEDVPATEEGHLSRWGPYVKLHFLVG